MEYGWLLQSIQYVFYGLIVPCVMWVFRVEKRMQTMEAQLNQAKLDRDKNEKRLEEFLKQNREDLKEIRTDIKKLLERPSLDDSFKK